MSYRKNVSLLFLSFYIGMLLIACDKPSDSRKQTPKPPAPESTPAPSPTPSPEPPTATEPKESETENIPGERDVTKGKLYLLRELQSNPVHNDRNVRGFAPSTKRMDLGENEVFNLKIVISSDGKFQAEVTKTRWCEFVLFRPKCNRKVRSFSTGTWEYAEERIVLIDDQRFVVGEIDAELKDSYIMARISVLKLEWLNEGVPMKVQLSVYSGSMPYPFPFAHLSDENRL